jgi:hypothetical protein
MADALSASISRTASRSRGPDAWRLVDFSNDAAVHLVVENVPEVGHGARLSRNRHTDLALAHRLFKRLGLSGNAHVGSTRRHRKGFFDGRPDCDRPL